MDVLQRRKRASIILLSTIVIFLFAWAHVSERFDGFAPIITHRSSSGITWMVPSSSYSGPSARQLIDSIKEATSRASRPSSSAAVRKEAVAEAPQSHSTGPENEPHGASEPVSPSLPPVLELQDSVSDEDGTRASEEDDSREWNRRNPCQSRSELVPLYDSRKHARKLPANPLWEELLTEYSKLHQACTQSAGNLTNYLLTRNVTTGCKFLIADVAPGTGLGNKLVVLVSALLYAVLTQRVILVPSTTLVPESTCEPFPGSSWRLDSETFPVPHHSEHIDFKGTPWTHDYDFFNAIDAEMGSMDKVMLESFRRGQTLPASPLKHAVGVIDFEWQPANRFYCSAEQAFYSQATWVYTSGCIYTIPKLFASPAFRPALEELFPDKMAASRLLRSAFLPSDDVWNRVRRIDHAYLAGADRRVGIQVRYKDGESHYKRMNDLVNERITNCAHDYNLLPNVTTRSSGSGKGGVGCDGGDSGSSPGLTFSNGSNAESRLNTSLSSSNSVDPESSKPVLKVFVASLFPGLLEHLSKSYVRYPTTSGEDVALVQISQDRTQRLNSFEEDQQAYTEILLLSLSDQLLVTPVSTFGALAQAYGALTPWFIEMGEDKKLPSCKRGQTVDICNQFTDKAYRCPHDRKLNDKQFSKVVPYIKDCLSIDHDGGIQLITDSYS